MWHTETHLLYYHRPNCFQTFHLCLLTPISLQWYISGQTSGTTSGGNSGTTSGCTSGTTSAALSVMISNFNILKLGELIEFLFNFFLPYVTLAFVKLAVWKTVHYSWSSIFDSSETENFIFSWIFGHTVQYIMFKIQ